MSKIELEIAQLAEQLQTLRLPHKLNQYRSYQRRLLSLKKLAESIPSDASQTYHTQLNQLQGQLDSSVLCGVSECFLCGDQVTSQSGAPVKAPVYNRSVSASFISRPQPRPKQNEAVPLPPSYTKQISNIEPHLTRVESSSTKAPTPAMPELPTPPESPATASVISEDSFSTGGSEASAEQRPLPDDDKVEGILEAHEETTTECTTLDKGHSVTSNNEQVTQVILTPTGSNANCTTERSDKSRTERKDVVKSASGLPLRASSYRAYKDFVNNYSTDRNKSDQVSDKRVA